MAEVSVEADGEEAAAVALHRFNVSAAMPTRQVVGRLWRETRQHERVLVTGLGGALNNLVDAVQILVRASAVEAVSIKTGTVHRRGSHVPQLAITIARRPVPTMASGRQHRVSSFVASLGTNESVSVDKITALDVADATGAKYTKEVRAAAARLTLSDSGARDGLVPLTEGVDFLSGALASLNDQEFGQAMSVLEKRAIVPGS
ncbi:DNA/RNA-binding protein Alba-like domain-containing protein [Plasmodiophora brassicae]